MSSTPRTLIRRPARSIPASILALVLLALGGIGCWVLGAFLITGSWPQQAAAPIQSIADLGWAQTPLIVSGIVLAILGVILLGAALLPGSSRRLAVLHSDVPGETAMSHRDAARRIRYRTEQVDGVQGVATRFRSRSVRVDVRTPLQDTSTVRSASTAAVQAALAELRPTAPLRARVRVRSTD